MYKNLNDGVFKVLKQFSWDNALLKDEVLKLLSGYLDWIVSLLEMFNGVMD